MTLLTVGTALAFIVIMSLMMRSLVNIEDKRMDRPKKKKTPRPAYTDTGRYSISQGKVPVFGTQMSRFVEKKHIYYALVDCFSHLSNFFDSEVGIVVIGLKLVNFIDPFPSKLSYLN